MEEKARNADDCCLNCIHSFYASQWSTDEIPEQHCGRTGKVVTDEQWCPQYE